MNPFTALLVGDVSHIERFLSDLEGIISKVSQLINSGKKNSDITGEPYL